MCQARMWVDPAKLMLFVCFGSFLAGCGESEAPPQAKPAANSEELAAHASDLPPVAAISSAERPAEAAPSSNVTAVPGSPEARLLEIADLVAAANAIAAQIKADEPDPAVTEPSPLSQKYRHQLSRIIELATDVIAATHLNPAPDAAQSMNNAVHYLSDARLELATLGDAEQARLLLEDADSLYERDPKSFAAAEAGFKVVELAERMARSLGSQDTEWLSEHATQALQFAERFPQESNRAAMGLYTAGRLCDRYGLREQARSCLEQVQRQFGSTVFAQQSAGVLRRLSLLGQPLEFTGATIDGGFVDLAQYAGSPVLIAFWASTSTTFREHLPELQQIEAEFAGTQFAIIGVNLDKDEAAVDAYIAQNSLTWPQIFSPDPDQRGGRNPVARYYGVQVLPTYWLVAPDGTVANDDVVIATLRDDIRKLLSASR